MAIVIACANSGFGERFRRVMAAAVDQCALLLVDIKYGLERMRGQVHDMLFENDVWPHRDICWPVAESAPAPALCTLAQRAALWRECLWVHTGLRYHGATQYAGAQPVPAWAARPEQLEYG